METGTVLYGRRSAFVQLLCPAPKRHLQRLIAKYGLASGLDIGCGGGSPLTSMRNDRFHSTGIDIDEKCIQICKSRNTHDELIIGDFRSFEFDRQFDVVVLSHVIEHFSRDEGMRVITRIEALAKRLIYIETPNGFLEQTDWDGNIFQRHLSGWFPHDFEGRGYTVFGAGPQWFARPMGQSSFLPAPIERAITRTLQWYYFRRPNKAAAIAAIKYFDELGNLRKV